MYARSVWLLLLQKLTQKLTSLYRTRNCREALLDIAQIYKGGGQNGRRLLQTLLRYVSGENAQGGNDYCTEKEREREKDVARDSFVLQRGNFSWNYSIIAHSENSRRSISRET